MMLRSAVRAAALNSWAQEDSFGHLGNSHCSESHCGVLPKHKVGWAWSVKIPQCFRENKNSVCLGTAPEVSSQPSNPKCNFAAIGLCVSITRLVKIR